MRRIYDCVDFSTKVYERVKHQKRPKNVLFFVVDEYDLYEAAINQRQQQALKDNGGRSSEARGSKKTITKKKLKVYGARKKRYVKQ